jgi:hypothetical protein
METHHPAAPSLLPFARPDGACLGCPPEEEHEEPVPVAPAGPKDQPVEPAEPMNPA